MIDIVMTTIAGAFHGVGNLLEGIFGKQPKLEDVRRQVEGLQADLPRLEESSRVLEEELRVSLAAYSSLKFYQFMQKGEMKRVIQDELVCQYASADYLTLLVDTAISGAKMKREDLDFYWKYVEIMADDRIDEDELFELRPYMWTRHREEIENLYPCDFTSIFDRIREYRAV